MSVLAGEKSGNLSGVLEYYIAYQRVTTGFRKKLIATLIYPIILVCAATVIVTYLVELRDPEVRRTLQRPEYQPAGTPTRILLAVTVTYRPYLLAAVAALVVAGRRRFRLVPIRSGRVDDGADSDAPAAYRGDAHEISVRAILPHALDLAGGRHAAGAGHGNGRPERFAAAWSRARSRKARSSVREGQSLHSSLSSTGLVPELALEMIEVGEASGSLSAMLGSVAEFYEDDVNTHMANMVALIEPAILIFMAILIAFILVALYLPMFSLSVGGQG